MTLKEKIVGCINNALPAWSVIIDDLYNIDIAIEHTAAPIAAVVLPLTGTLEWRNGRVYKGWQVNVGFLNVVPKDPNGEDRCKVIEDCEAAASEFMAAVVASGWFERLDGKQQTNFFMPQQSSNVITGVMLTLNLTEVEGKCYG